jgi:hypothetical protein
MRASYRVWIGAVMILAGVIFLVDNLNLITISPYIWGILLIAGGLFFLYIYAADRTQWWSVIPSFIFLGLGAIALLVTAFPEVQGELIPTIILGAIGLSFVVVYLSDRENWWAIIPAGILVSLALALGVSSATGGLGLVSILFLGIGLTFGILYFLPTPEGRQTWAVYPALGSLAAGVLFSFGASSIGPYIWPLALIIGGIILVFRTFRKQ